MSLVAFAIRVAAVRVLRAALPAAFVVVDSPVDPIASLDADPASALVAIYTGRRDNRLEGVGFFAGEPLIDLELQIFLPQQMSFGYADAAGAAQTVTLDTRGEGSETALDLIERMIARAFAVKADVWSDLFGRFVQTISKTVSASYLVETSKVKAAAREIRLSCDALQEPAPGAPLSELWSTLLAAMQADASSSDSVAQLAPWIAAELAAPAGLSQVEIDRIFLGLSRYAMQAIGLGPGDNSTPATDLADGAPAQETVDVPATPDSGA